MVCKRLAALIAVMLFLAMPAAYAAGGSGQELAGTVPYLLTATSDKDARCMECSLGNAVADAARKYLDTDIAIVCGGDLKGNLPSGDITWDELNGVFAEDRTLATTVVTIGQLQKILEVGVSHIQLNEKERIDPTLSAYDGFPQISGFAFSYDVSAPVGQRVYEINVNGERLDMEDESITFKLAATGFMLEGGYDLPIVEQFTPSEMTLAEITARYINDGMGNLEKTGNRIVPMGTADGVLTGSRIGVIALTVIFVTVFSKVGIRRRGKSGYYF